MGGLIMREHLICELESFLHQQDFGRNWDGAYQDVIPTIRKYFITNGFETHFLTEWESPSRDAQLVAKNKELVIRIPWAEDYNGRSIVHLHTIQVHQSNC
jgi:hypothetical protein